MLLRPNFTPIQWAWIIVGPVISIGSKVYEGWQMATTLMGLQLWVYECLGLTIFFSAIIGLLIGYKRDIEERLSKKAEATGQIEATRSNGIELTGHTPSGAEFFPTIDDLRAKHPLPEIFKPGNEIHAYFLTGEGVFGEHSEYVKYVKRLILPLPDDRNLERLHGLSDTIDFKAQIYKYRNIARKNNKQSVHFYKDFTGISLLFSNPDRLHAWVQVGTILPESEPAERQHYRLYKASHEKAFISLYETFNRLWKDSNENTEEEDMAEGADKETERMSCGSIRVLPTDKRQILAAKLKSYASSDSNVDVLFATLDQKSFAELLISVFQANGWKANLTNKGQGSEASPYNEHIEVSGHNKHFVEAIGDALREVGLKEVKTKIEPLGFGELNPKWNWAQHKIQIIIGNKVIEA